MPEQDRFEGDPEIIAQALEVVSDDTGTKAVAVIVDGMYLTLEGKTAQQIKDHHHAELERREVWRTSRRNNERRHLDLPLPDGIEHRREERRHISDRREDHNNQEPAA